MINVAAARASRDALEAALARRRLAKTGGAYAALLVPRGARRGALAGVPVAVKDLIDVAGTPTRAGSWTRHDARPAKRDAPVVAALRRAGAAIVGKTALHELAFGTTGINAFEGTPRNPRDRIRIPGGSSSGSAVAVAEGSAALALGTDTGGSVRIPAALCGVVGLKPTYGALSLRGVLPLAPTLDHVGLLAADVESVRLGLAALAPRLDLDARVPTVIGIAEAELAEAWPDVAEAISTALQQSGLGLKAVRLPDPQRVADASTAIIFHEAARTHERTLRDRAGFIGADVRERLRRGSAIALREYRTALRERKRIRAELGTLLERYDAVALPTVGFVAPPIASVAADRQLPTKLVRFTRLGNLTGFPAISLPVPTSGPPIGLQILARTDALALVVASFIERTLRESRSPSRPHS